MSLHQIVLHVVAGTGQYSFHICPENPTVYLKLKEVKIEEPVFHDQKPSLIFVPDANAGSYMVAWKS